MSFGELGSGQVFGEYAAIDHGPRSASVEARTSCLVASMPADVFRTLLETQPTVTLAVLTQLVKRTRTVTRRVYEFSTLHVDNRIQAEVLRLATLACRNGKEARIVPPWVQADPYASRCVAVRFLAVAIDQHLALRSRLRKQTEPPSASRRVGAIGVIASRRAQAAITPRRSTRYLQANVRDRQERGWQARASAPSVLLPRSLFTLGGGAARGGNSPKLTFIG